MSTTLFVKDGDIWIDEDTGQAEWISGPSKTAQDFAEILSTPLKDGYGTRLVTLQFPEVIGELAGESIVGAEVSDTIDRLKRAQQREQATDSSELIVGVEQLVVKKINDGTGGTYAYFASLQTQDGGAVNQAMAVSMRHRQSDAAQLALNELASQFVPGGSAA